MPHCRTNRKSSGRGKSRLDRSGAQSVGDADFVASMGAKCIMLHQLHCHLLGEGGVEPSLHVDRRQFFMFVSAIIREPLALAIQDIEKADGIARRATGLDSNHSAPKVNVALNLVNQRILAMQGRAE